MTRNVILACLAALVVSPIGFAQEKDKKPGPPKKSVKFTIGKDTTHITSPLDADGRPDYVTALNERLREGVTPENNAAALLVKALGPAPDKFPRPAAYYEWLKIPVPPEKGDYFVIRHGDFFRDHLKLEPLDHVQKFSDDKYAAQARPWTTKEFPHVAALLKVNAKPLALAIEASKRSRYYSPLVPSKPKELLFVGSTLSGSIQCRHLGSALAMRAMLKTGVDLPEHAWQDLLACHRLGRHVSRSGSFIESLVGLAICEMAHDANLALLDSGKLNARQLKSCLHDLQALPALPEMADIIDLGERYFFLDAVMHTERTGGAVSADDPKGKDGQALIDYDHALRRGNEMFNKMVAAMRHADRTEREQRLLDVAKLFKRKPLPSLPEIAKAAAAGKDLEEILGKFTAETLIQQLTPAAGKLQHAAERAGQRHRNLQIAFALAAYKSDHGRYPKTLDALAPEYLRTIPNDLFNDKSVAYRPREDGYLLYSVGVNGKNDDGTGDDLTVRMPIPKK